MNFSDDITYLLDDLTLFLNLENTFSKDYIKVNRDMIIKESSPYDWDMFDRIDRNLFFNRIGYQSNIKILFSESCHQTFVENINGIITITFCCFKKDNKQKMYNDLVYIMIEAIVRDIGRKSKINNSSELKLFLYQHYTQ